MNTDMARSGQCTKKNKKEDSQNNKKQKMLGFKNKHEG